jgi:hypothetical protein
MGLISRHEPLGPEFVEVNEEVILMLKQAG